jgi:hypothetical protein
MGTIVDLADNYYRLSINNFVEQTLDFQFPIPNFHLVPITDYWSRKAIVSFADYH